MASMDARVPELISRGRLETLSDGVFAIVVTLLVLELHAPHLEHATSVPEATDALLALAPKFVSWVISFVTVCVVWLNHHRLMAILGRIDHGLFWWNANLLLWTSLIPFPTAFMGDYAANPLAVSFYGVVMGLMAIGFVLLRLHLHRHPELLVDPGTLGAVRQGTTWSIVFGPVAYALGALLAWVNVLAAFACYAAIALYFVFPHHLKGAIDTSPRHSSV